MSQPSPIEGLLHSLNTTETFFLRSISQLTEADSAFSPTPEGFTVSAQVAHVAITVEWFMEGAFGKGWEMDFEADVKKANAVTSLAAAIDKFKHAMEAARAILQKQSPSTLNASFPTSDPFFPGAPKIVIFEALVDHTAHHRGALTVYTRLCGKVPPMPYM